MNKDSWIALIIASVITIVAATPILYSRDYANKPNGKMTEGSDTKTVPMKGAVGGGNEEPNLQKGDREGNG